MRKIDVNVFRLSKSRSGKAVSVYKRDGSVFGSVRVDTIGRVVRGEVRGAPVRRRDGSGRWKTVGWLNRTMKDGLLKFNDKKGFLASVPSDGLFSVIEYGFSFFIYGEKKSKRSKRSGFKPDFK